MRRLGLAGAAVLAALGATTWLHTNANDLGPAPELVYGLDDGTFVLIDDEAAATERRRFGWGEAGAAPVVRAAGRGRALVAGDAATLLAPLDGGLPTRLGAGRLVPLGPWWGLGGARVEGVVLGDGDTAPVAVDLEAGIVRPLADLASSEREPATVTSYGTDGRQAIVAVGAARWLVAIVGDDGPVRLAARWAGFSGAGDRLAVLRDDPGGRQVLVVSAPDGTASRQVWSGAGALGATWSGDAVVLIAADAMHHVDVADGHVITTTVAGLDPVSLDPSRGTLVAAGAGGGGGGVRWFRLDETGAEVTELADLRPLPLVEARGGRIAFADLSGSALVAWNLRERRVETLSGSSGALDRLGEPGVGRQSPEGRFVVSAGPDPVLGDFRDGGARPLDAGAAGSFRPDGRRFVVVADDGRLGILDPAAPERPPVELPPDARTAAWVYP